MGLYAALLFYLSSLHHPSVPRFPYSDKVMHLGFYAGFGLVFAWACDPGHRGWGLFRIVLASALAAALYGTTDEFHQIFVAGRTPDLLDLLSDALGGCLGGLLYSAFTFAVRSCRKGKASADDPAVASL